MRQLTSDIERARQLQARVYYFYTLYYLQERQKGAGVIIYPAIPDSVAGATP